ncbi:hypothetical protein Vafri_8558 [Volvox africanus]|nr:hypothetical protein Vafri_8558 [Volvox africanus]
MYLKRTRAHLPSTQRGNEIEKPSIVRIGLISDTHGVVCPEVLQQLHGVDLILHAGDVGHHGGHAEVLARLATLAPVYAVRGNVDDDVDDDDIDMEQRYGHKSMELQRGGCAGGGGLGDVGEAGAKAGAELDGGSAEHTAGSGGIDRGHGGGGFGFGGHGLPNHRLLEVAGWRILMTHILGQPPHAVEPDAANLIARYDPQILVFGHSHKHLSLTHGSRRFYNPGSAGPARFKLPRTAAILVLPSREDPTADGNLSVEPSFSLITLAPRAPPRLASAAGLTKLLDSGGEHHTALYETTTIGAMKPLPLPVAALPSGVMTRSRARGGSSGNSGGCMDAVIGRRRGRGRGGAAPIENRTTNKRVKN